MPCPWSFNKAAWRVADIICTGKCPEKGCDARIQAVLAHRTSNLQITVENFKSTVPHNPLKKRRIKGEAKDNILEILSDKSAFQARNELARKMQDPNLPERPDIPSSNTMRVMKHHQQISQGSNAFEALDILKNVHVNCIHKIGYDPFFVFYETPSQSEYYAKERLKSRSIISIDATGVGVKSPTSNPKCIFLYNIVMHGNYLFRFSFIIIPMGYC